MSNAPINTISPVTEPGTQPSPPPATEPATPQTGGNGPKKPPTN